MNVLRVLLVGLLASACAGSVELYDGPARDLSELGVIRRKGRGDLVVFQIDDYETRGFEWHVEPGPHRVWVELKQYGEAMNVSFTAWTYCSIDFEAKAGEAYQVVSENNQRRAAVDTEVTLGVRIVDANDELVGTPECTDRRPRFQN
jgi:hypothetical protein